jgi:hypothetical protein
LFPNTDPEDGSYYLLQNNFNLGSRYALLAWILKNISSSAARKLGRKSTIQEPILRSWVTTLWIA